MSKGFYLWLYAIVLRDGWWKKHPKEWAEISKTKGKLMQSVPLDKLPAKYKKRGTPIHSIRCKVCGESWFTSCKLPLCKRLSCWIKYHGGKY